MVLVNYTTRELTAKLVYYGPGLCGKTTNLQYVYDHLLPKDRRGKMVSLATETDRTLFFDFLPLELGTIRGLKTRLQLYTVPGQVHYNATRKIVLKGADGIVFVADSQLTAREANIAAYQNMKANLAEHGLELKQLPHVFQFNKRDLPGVMPVDQMVDDLNEHNVPFWDAVAIEGIGVEDTLKGITKLVLKSLAARFSSEAPRDAELPAAVSAGEKVAAAVPAAREETLVGARAAAAAPTPAATAHADLLSLEFGAVAPPAGGDDEILEVGDEALLLEEGSADDPFGSAGATPAHGTMRPGPLEMEMEAAAVAAAPVPPAWGQVASAPAFIESEPDEADAMASGDTYMSPEPLEGMPTEADLPGFGAGPASDLPLLADDDDVMVSGDTYLSPEPLEGMPTEADLPKAAQAPVIVPLEAELVAPPPDEAPVLSADYFELVADDEEPSPLPVAPPRPPPPSAAPVERPWAAEPVAAEPPLRVAVPIVLGKAVGGTLVERELEIPVEWQDADGTKRQKTLKVALRFELS